MADAHNPPDQPQQAIASFSSTPQAPVLYYAHGEIVMAYFSESEIDTIAGMGHSSIYLAFFGICIGVFFTLLAVFLGSDVTDPKKLAIGYSLMFVSGIGSVVFGLLGKSEYKNANERKAEFKLRFRTAAKTGT